jgi:outer membrane murein-binding lipoprotein Lpp
MSLMQPGQVNIPPEAIHAAIMLGRYFLAGCVVLGIVPPVIRLIARRFERPVTAIATLTPDVTARLERIEQAVEAVAIEVERITEAQRFSAKLAAEQAQRSLPRSDAGR